MGERQLQNAEEKTSKYETRLSLEHQPPELNLGNLLVTHLAGLQTQNPEAFAILTEKIQEGFFGESHGKKTLNDFADQILQTIVHPEEENAD